MATEEDTFRRLAQIPFNDIFYQWIESPIPAQSLYPDTTPEEINPDIQKFFSDRGWTYLEFIKQDRQR